jgi:predicted nuclease of restriction endonuclease-like (RecB) superfamily
LLCPTCHAESPDTRENDNFFAWVYYKRRIVQDYFSKVDYDKLMSLRYCIIKNCTVHGSFVIIIKNDGTTKRNNKRYIARGDVVMEQKFYDEIKKILSDARNRVYQTANFAMVEAYWNIGKNIVEQQGGEEKAEYGVGLIKDLSNQMTRDFGKGFTAANLKNMRQFYLTFPNGYALRSELSWTHYRLLMRVENNEARNFYFDESIKSNWSTRQLERQINSFFYERLLSSQNKEKVSEEIGSLEPNRLPEDIIRDPYVLEFLGLNPNDDFYESDLEEALITHLQKFLLELGRGFSFVARQKRITFDGRHFRIDLVFYNYILKCFVLIDLKIGDLTHQDLGQMQMYVHYYERELMNEGDNPPIGIVLCADKSESVVKYTLPENDTQIYASKYKLYLPSEEELLQELRKEYNALEANSRMQ